jgi:hypothetical protein
MAGVEITLGADGERKETLRPTLKAARFVNGMGGFSEVVRRISSLDLETHIAVVAAGLDQKPTKVEQAVYERGLRNLIGPLVDFVMLLANGGRPIEEAAEDPASGEA